MNLVDRIVVNEGVSPLVIWLFTSHSTPPGSTIFFLRLSIVNALKFRARANFPSYVAYDRLIMGHLISSVSALVSSALQHSNGLRG